MGVEAQHIGWMRHALMLAKRAESEGEVPVGAVVIKDGQIIGEGWNQPIGHHDPSAHAEIMALRDAARRIENYRLTDCDLYVTLEPCVMCAGAITHARIRRLTYATSDPKAGAVESVFDVLSAPKLNHSVVCEGGLLAEEAGELLRQFFRSRRN